MHLTWLFFFAIITSCASVAVTAQTERWRITSVSDTILTRLVPAPATSAILFGTALNDGQLRSVDVTTGALRWTFFPGAFTNIFSAPVVTSDGQVIFGTSFSRIFSIYETTGLQKWSLTINGAVRTDGILSADGNTYYVGDDSGRFYAINVATTPGTLLWTFNAGTAIRGSPARDNAGNLYFGCLNASVYKLNSSGVQMWRFDSLAAMQGKLLVSSDQTLVFGGSDRGDIHAIQTATGLQQYRYQTTNNPIRTALAEDATTGIVTIFVGLADGSLHAFRASNGATLWTYEAVTSGFVSSPVVQRSFVFFTASDGKVHSVNQTAKRIEPPYEAYMLGGTGAGVMSTNAPVLLDGMLVTTRGKEVVAMIDPTYPRTTSPYATAPGGTGTTTQFPFSTYVSNPADRFLRAGATATWAVACSLVVAALSALV
jgi:outer membrane protein assembly factor BamB